MDPSTRRFVLFPITYSGIWSLYKEALHVFFTAEDVVPYTSAEKEGSEAVSREEVHTLLLLLTSDYCPLPPAMFSTSIQSAEARAFLGLAGATDNIVRESYSLLLRALFPKALPLPLVYHGRCSSWVSSTLTPAPRTFAQHIACAAIASSIFYCATSRCVSLLSPNSPLVGAGGLFIRVDQTADRWLAFARLVLTELEERLPDQETVEMVEAATASETQFWTALWTDSPEIADEATRKVRVCAERVKSALTGLPVPPRIASPEERTNSGFPVGLFRSCDF